MSIDPVTATLAAVKIGSAIIGMMSSSADPGQVVVFETYQAVLAISDQLDGVQDGLTLIHDAVIDLSKGVDDKLDQQSAQQAANQLKVSLAQVATIHGAFLDALAESDIAADKAWQNYNDDIQAAMNDFQRSLILVTQGAPLSLHLALNAAAVELYLGRRPGSNVNSPDTRARQTMTAIRALAEGDLSRRIDIAKARMETDRAAFEKLVAIDNWTTSRQAVVMAGSFYSPWLNYGSFLCLQFDRDVVYPKGDITLFSIPSTDLLTVTRNGEAAKMAGAVCGSEVTEEKGIVMVDGVAIKLVTAPDVRWEQVSSKVSNLPSGTIVPGPKSPYGVLEETNKRYQDARLKVEEARGSAIPAFNAAQQALTLANVSAARYALLAGYRDDILAAVEVFETRTIANAGVDKAELWEQGLSAELAALSSFATGDLYETLAALSQTEDDVAKQLFRHQMAETALAAERRIAVGLARYQGAIKAYDQDRTRDIAKVLKKVTMALEIIDATKKLGVALTAAEPAAVPKSGTAVVAATEPATPAVTPAASGATAVLLQSRWQEARKILDELKRLGPPTTNPNRAGLQDQEKLAGRLSDILVNWGPTQADLLYDKYQSARDTAVKDGMDAIANLNVLEAARIILRETLVPNMTAPADLDSIRERDSFQAEARPWLEATRNWRLGLPSKQ